MHVPGRDTRVVELRVHGILGTTGDALTDAVASVDVAGDGVGRIVRPADQYCRPLPGPTLSAGDRTIPRVVEGYVWGAMTSGGLVKATWALLFPFALANMAHWMLPPTRPDSRASQMLSSVLRALLRLAGLLLTMLFVAQIGFVSFDLIATQCLGKNAGCMAIAPDALRTTDSLRGVVGLLPVALVVLLLHRMTSVSWRVSASARTAEQGPRPPILPESKLVSDPDTPALRALHVAGALAAVVLLVLGSDSGDPRSITAMALVAIAVIGAVALDDPTGLWAKSSSLVLRTALGPVPRRTLMAIGALLLATVPFAPPATATPLPGSSSTIDWITAALLVSWVAVALLLIPSALLARKAWKSLAKELRPWAGGWMAAPMLLVACLLGNGFGAGLAYTVQYLLGDARLRLPTAYLDATVFWGSAVILLVLGALGFVAYALINRVRTREAATISAEIALLHAGRQEDQRNAATAWRWADVQRRYAHRGLLVAAGLLVTSVGFSLFARLTGVSDKGITNLVVVTGVGVLWLVAVGLMRMIYQAAKDPKTARYMGILCDLTLFWPREAHPMVPPCYALKVVPELAARAREHLADPNTRVVLVGHSQGSLLAAVATARLLENLPEADRERVGLVTAGSQLQWAYPRAFPGIVPHDALRSLAGSLGGRWRSLCRGTDPLGGPVSTWRRQVYDGMLIGVGFKDEGGEGPLPAAVRGPTGALVLGGDHWLPDPQREPSSSRRWLPGVLGHSDYSSDPEWDRAVAMAAGLEIPVRGSTLPLRIYATTAAGGSSRGAETLVAEDGLDLPTSDADWDSELSEVLADARRQDDVPQTNGHKWNEEEKNTPVRKTVPSEIVDPRGRTAPWERGVNSSLRPTSR